MTFSISEPIKLDTDTIKSLAVEIFSLQETNQPKAPAPADDLITPAQACEILKCTSVTLWRYEKKGRVNPYGICGKKYFKRSEILNSIVKK
ncbi:helix-turn-helix domain-containing protein [Bizionia sp.]|uniref:helix-turn-helix domain-containing protein n=1 Tax=Bizionia sp. TaxID=1954480 RepID=UPI003A8F8C0C